MRNTKQKTLAATIATTITTVLLSGFMATPAMAAPANWYIAPACMVMGAQRLNVDDPTEVTAKIYLSTYTQITDAVGEGTWRLDTTDPELINTFVDGDGNELVSARTPNTTIEITDNNTNETVPFEHNLGERELSWDGTTLALATSVDYVYHAPVEQSMLNFRIGFSTGIDGPSGFEGAADYAFCLTTIEEHNPNPPVVEPPVVEPPVVNPPVVEPPVVNPPTVVEPPVGPKVNSGADYSTNPAIWLPVGLATILLGGLSAVLAVVRKRETNVAE